MIGTAIKAESLADFAGGEADAVGEGAGIAVGNVIGIALRRPADWLYRNGPARGVSRSSASWS